MGRKKRKQIAQVADAMVDLNVMPFIDIFSLLCTFLLFSAVFVSIGVVEVQIPFLSNAAPPKEQKKAEDNRDLEVKVEISKKEIKLTSSFSRPPVDMSTTGYDFTESGLAKLHSKLVSLKDANPESDKITVFIDDDVIYDEIIGALDQIQLRYPDGSGKVTSQNNEGKNVYLFQKIVFGSVLL